MRNDCALDAVAEKTRTDGALVREPVQEPYPVCYYPNLVRTGMANSEMTCALPAKQLAEFIERLATSCAVDNAIEEYASKDIRRFPV